MFIQTGEGQFLDLMALLFMGVALLGLIASVIALIVGRKAKNSYRGLVIALAILTIGLFIGALVTGIIGLKPRVYSYWYWRGRDDPSTGEYIETLVFETVHRATAWVCLGLGSGAGLCGLLSFIVQLATRKIVDDERKVTKAADVEKDDSDVLFYEEFSQGAIEVREDYLVVYKNWLPFTGFRAGRVSMIVFINDIQHIEYKGSGWFPGLFTFTFRHPNRPVRFFFGKWFFWRRMAFNKRMTPVYDYIRARVIKNNK